MTTQMVKVDFRSLQESNIIPSIEDAFERALGLDGLGALVITNIPNFDEIRKNVLDNMYRLSNEPKNVLESLSSPNSQGSIYEVGYESNHPLKEQYGYNHCVSFFSRYPKESLTFPEDITFEQKHSNVWPSTIKEFKNDLWNMNEIIAKSVTGLLKYVDNYLKKYIKDYPNNKFVSSFYNSYSDCVRCMKYLPIESSDLSQGETWEGWHIDVNLFTALVYPLYCTKSGEDLVIDSTSLAIKDRKGNEHLLNYSRNEIVIFTSEIMIIESSGFIPATPHKVIIAPGIPKNISRLQVASFFEPYLSTVVNIPTNESCREVVNRSKLSSSYSVINSDIVKSGITKYKDYFDYVLSVQKA